MRRFIIAVLLSIAVAAPAAAQTGTPTTTTATPTGCIVLDDQTFTAAAGNFRVYSLDIPNEIENIYFTATVTPPRMNVYFLHDGEVIGTPYPLGSYNGMSLSWETSGSGWQMAIGDGHDIDVAVTVHVDGCYSTDATPGPTSTPTPSAQHYSFDGTGPICGGPDMFWILYGRDTVHIAFQPGYRYGVWSTDGGINAVYDTTHHTYISNFPYSPTYYYPSDDATFELANPETPASVHLCRGDLPPTDTPVPTDTSTPTITNTPTDTSTPTITSTPTDTSTPISTPTNTPTSPAMPCAIANRIGVPVAPGTAQIPLSTGARFVVSGASVWLNIGPQAYEIRVGNYEWSLEPGSYTAYSLTEPAQVWICAGTGATNTPTAPLTATAITVPTPGQVGIAETAVCVPLLSPTQGNAYAMPDLSLVLPTMRPLPTLAITVTTAISTTQLAGMLLTVESGAQTPMAAVGTMSASYSWQAGADTAASSIAVAAPALAWLQIVNPGSPAWQMEGGPLWSIWPMIGPVLPILSAFILAYGGKIALWIVRWILALIDVVIKLIELIPGE